MCFTIGTSASIQIRGFLYIPIGAHMTTRAARLSWDGVQLCSGTRISSFAVSSSVFSDGHMCIILAISVMHYKAISVLEVTLQTMTASQLKLVQVTTFVRREPTICFMATQECILCFDSGILFFPSLHRTAAGFSNYCTTKGGLSNYWLGHPISRRTNCHGYILRSMICFGSIVYGFKAAKTAWVPRDDFGFALFVYQSASSGYCVALGKQSRVSSVCGIHICYLVDTGQAS